MSKTADAGQAFTAERSELPMLYVLLALTGRELDGTRVVRQHAAKGGAARGTTSGGAAGGVDGG